MNPCPLVIGLAALALASPAGAQSPEPREVIFWKVPPGYRHLGPAGGYYPDRASRLGITGFAVIDCQVLEEGVLDGCLAVEASPADSAFDQAALVMARRGAIRTTGAPTQGTDTVRLTVPFKMRIKARLAR
jgi:TonB family protein